MKQKQCLRNVLAVAISSVISLPTVAATLEEVIVTSQKRMESVNDMAVSASAFAGDTLNELGVDQPVDLGAHTPGLVTVNSTSGGTPIFAIRGIGLDDFNANNTSGVGVYTDGIFASSPLYLGGQLFDIERVEVLKGPQGTLYGKNTTGGAINFLTYRPTEELTGYVEADYSSHETVEVIGVVSGPLSDNVLGRLSANYVKSSEGWQEEVNTGEEFGEKDTFAIRGQLAIGLGDGDGEALIRAYHTKDKSKPLSPSSEGAGDALGDAFFDVLDSPSSADRVLVGGLDVGRDEDGSGLSLTVEYAFNNFDFISISAIDQYNRDFVDNYDGQAIASTDLYGETELEQLSQELRFISNGDGPFSWILGFNLSHEEVDDTNALDDSFLIDFEAENPSRGLDVITSSYIQKTDSYGAYLHTETELNDELRLTAAIRYSYDDRSFDGVASNTSFGTVFPIVAIDDSQTEDDITGKIGLDWQVNYDLLVFTNVATSYKGGLFFGGAIIDGTSWGYLEPEEILSYELGFKWTLLDSSVQINGSLFKMEYENRQSLVGFTADDFSNLTAFPTSDVTMINIPESETQGFELDVAWAATDGLTLQAGIAYLDAEISKAPGSSELRGISSDSSINDSATGDLNGNFVIDGSEVAFVDGLNTNLEPGTTLSQAPEWSYNALAAYEFEVGNDLVARLQTSYSWVDSMAGALSDDNAIVNNTSSTNAQASIGDIDGDWTLTLWGRNITNEESDTYSFTNFTSGRTVYRQQPATYGVTLNYQIW